MCSIFCVAQWPMKPCCFRRIELSPPHIDLPAPPGLSGPCSNGPSCLRVKRECGMSGVTRLKPQLPPQLSAVSRARCHCRPIAAGRRVSAMIREARRPASGTNKRDGRGARSASACGRCSSRNEGLLRPVQHPRSRAYRAQELRVCRRIQTAHPRHWPCRFTSA